MLLISLLALLALTGCAQDYSPHPSDMPEIQAVEIFGGSTIYSPYLIPDFPERRFTPYPMPLPAPIWVSDIVAIPIEIPSPGEIQDPPPLPKTHGFGYVILPHSDVVIQESDDIVMPPVKRNAP